MEKTIKTKSEYSDYVPGFMERLRQKKQSKLKRIKNMLDEMPSRQYINPEEKLRKGWIVMRNIYNEIDAVEKNLCTGEYRYEEFERGAKIACNNIRLQLRRLE